VPRQLRVEYEGAIYHVMSRGDRHEDIVRGDADRELWIKTLSEACRKCDWQVHAYCLMTNHFHLVVETPLGNLVSGMKWLLGTYTVRFNTRHRLHGHLFAGRYKSVLVDELDDAYLRVACDYVHLNPARAGLLKAGQPLSDYAWSSYRDYLQLGPARPGWLRTDRLMGEHGAGRDDRRSRLEFSRRMEAERREVNQASESHELMRRGWRLGGEAFLARLLDRLEGKLTENHLARERTDAIEMKVERIIRARLAEIGWSENDLRERAKCAPEKIDIAHQLRAETTLSLKKVAERLSMGTWTNVSSLLYKGTKQ
jgi:REP element-mobilizing transposase RayT